MYDNRCLRMIKGFSQICIIYHHVHLPCILTFLICILLGFWLDCTPKLTNASLYIYMVRRDQSKKWLNIGKSLDHILDRQKSHIFQVILSDYEGSSSQLWVVQQERGLKLGNIYILFTLITNYFLFTIADSKLMTSLVIRPP